MRLPLLLAAIGIATPAAAQPLPNQLPPEIASGQIIDQLEPVARGLSRALLDLPVGEIEAAVENRPLRPQDRNKRVRDMAGVDQRELDRSIAAGSETLKAAGQALVRALPAITRSLNQVGDELGRVMNNLPSPTYPRR